MTNTYDVGNLARLSVSFTNLTGVLTDPTTVILRVLDPSGAVSVYTPTRDSTGKFHYDCLLTLPGYWQYRFEGTGTLVAAVDGILQVLHSQVLGD